MRALNLVRGIALSGFLGACTEYRHAPVNPPTDAGTDSTDGNPSDAPPTPAQLCAQAQDLEGSKLSCTWTGLNPAICDFGDVVMTPEGDACSILCTRTGGGSVVDISIPYLQGKVEIDVAQLMLRIVDNGGQEQLRCTPAS